MTIEQMTHVSHIFAAASAAFAVLAAALFFAFDMRRVRSVLRSGFGTAAGRQNKMPRLRLIQNITYTEYREAVSPPISRCAESTLQIYRRKSYSKAHPNAGEPE